MLLSGRRLISSLLWLPLAVLWHVPLVAGQEAAAQTAPTPPASRTLPEQQPLPPDYVIGVEDLLAVVVWDEPKISGDVTVRPDGKISMPLINDVDVVGLTPEQLRLTLTTAIGKFVDGASVHVIVRQINSRKVFITGNIGRSGPFSLTQPTTILQLIATAGGVNDFADTKRILIIRNVNGQPVSYRFNYADVVRGKNLKQNIELKPGDQVVVP